MKRLVSLLVSLLILAALWHHADVRAIVAAMRGADPLRVGAGLAWVVPLTLITAWRFVLLSRTTLGIGAALRLILSASTLNLLLPSKMGDVAKAWVLRNRFGFDGDRALALVILEKLVDLASLLFWGVAALFLIAHGRALLLAVAGLGMLLVLLLLLLSPLDLTGRAMRAIGRRLPATPGRTLIDFETQWTALIGWFWRDRRRAALVWTVSLLLWAGHLVQIWMFARALGPAVPLAGSMAAATLAILAGLLPFTMAGIGTRDAALVLLYHPWLPAARGAALGVLATTRYLLPALAGLPFMHDYWDGRRALRAEQP